MGSRSGKLLAQFYWWRTSPDTPVFAPDRLNRAMQLQYGCLSHTTLWVKTTVELDEKKLLRVMALTGLKTRKEAIEYALTQGERAAKLAKLFARPWTKQDLEAALEPAYNLEALREREKPAHAH